MSISLKRLIDLHTKAMDDEEVNIVNNKYSFQAYYEIKDKTIFISFRGTDTLEDMKWNLIFKTSVIPYGNKNTKIKVHGLWLEQYQSIRSIIHDLIKMHTIEKAVLTGHSLGGALSIICAVDIQYNFFNDIEVYGFGTPRVGNRDFNLSYLKRVPKTYLFRHKNDFITSIPYNFMGYHQMPYIQLKPKTKLWELIVFRAIRNHDFDIFYANENNYNSEDFRWSSKEKVINTQ
jgi:predicted lipase